MRLAHVDGRIVPTAASVGSNSYVTLLGYLLVTAVVVLLTVRTRAREEGVGVALAAGVPA